MTPEGIYHILELIVPIITGLFSVYKAMAVKYNNLTKDFNTFKDEHQDVKDRVLTLEKTTISKDNIDELLDKHAEKIEASLTKVMELSLKNMSDKLDMFTKTAGKG